MNESTIYSPPLYTCRRVSGGVADIAVQLDVFDEQRECDDAQSLQGPSGINLSSHLDVFYAILGQVRSTPIFGKLKLELTHFIFVATGCRHTTRDSISKYFTTFTSNRSQRSDQRYHLGHGRNTGASCNIAGES